MLRPGAQLNVAVIVGFARGRDDGVSYSSSLVPKRASPGTNLAAATLPGRAGESYG